MNNLDNFYNKKLQNRKFEFKDSYWEDAEQLIIADEKNRRNGRYRWILGFLFILIIGGSLVWIGSPEPETGETATTFSKSPSENKASIVDSPKRNNNESADKFSMEENNLAELNIFNVNSSTPSTPTTDYSNIEIIKNEINTPIEKSNQTIKREDSRVSNNPIRLNKEHQTVKHFEANSEVLNEDDQETVFQNDKTSNNIIESEINRIVPDEINQPKSIRVSLLLPIGTFWDEIDEPANPKLKKISIPKTRLFNIGLTVSSLFYPAKNTEKAWIGANFGFIGQYKFLNALSLNAELLYTYRTGTFGITSKTVQTNYGFGKQLLEYSLHPESMHFVELPVYLQYRSGKHGIEGGLAFSYLAGVHGNIEKQTSLFPWERTNDSKISNENLSSGWVAKNDFNSFNTSLLLGYRYYFNRHFVLGLRSSYRLGNLLNITENKEQALLESGPVHFNVSASWFFLK